VIPRGTRVTSKSELAALLDSWHRDEGESTIGEVGRFGGKAWLVLDFPDLPRRARVNADTKREAVRDYLDDVARRGPEVPWRVVPNRRGAINKVVYTEDASDPPGWYCYLV
jgi:hypothetical protein